MKYHLFCVCSIFWASEIAFVTGSHGSLHELPISGYDCVHQNCLWDYARIKPHIHFICPEFNDVTAPNSSNPYFSRCSTDTQEASEELRGILISTFMSTICPITFFSKMTNSQSNTVINYHSCLWVPYTCSVISINFMARLNMYEKAEFIWSLMALPLCRFHLKRFQRTFSHNNVLSSQFSK